MPSASHAVGMMQWSACTRLPWLSTTPFGTPVEPEVYMMMAVSPGLGGATAAAEAEPSLITSSNLWKVTPSTWGGVAMAL